MTGNLILSRLWSLQDRSGAFLQPKRTPHLNLDSAWLYPDRLPKAASETPAIPRILDLLGPLE